MTRDRNFSLDNTLTDVVSGVSGVVIAVTEYRYSQPQYLLAFTDAKGEPREQWFEEERLVHFQKPLVKRLKKKIRRGTH